MTLFACFVLKRGGLIALGSSAVNKWFVVTSLMQPVELLSLDSKCHAILTLLGSTLLYNAPIHKCGLYMEWVTKLTEATRESWDNALKSTKDTLVSWGVMRFEWRDYINLHESLGKDKPALERVLDDIVATGEDGRALIKTAHSSLTEKVLTARDKFLEAEKKSSDELGIKHHDSAATGSKKIEIRGDTKTQAELLGIQNRGSMVHAFVPGLINLDMEQARRLTVDTPTGSARISLTGIVVHELFHTADIHLRLDVKASPEKQKEFFDKVIPSATLTSEQKKSVFRAYMAKLDEETKAILKVTPAQNAMGIATAMDAAYKKLAENEDLTTLDIAKRAGVAPKSFSLPFLKNPDAIIQEQTAILARAEEQATRYTDVFMAKHFAGEPWRDVYKNGRNEEKLGDIIIREAKCGTIESGVYLPESITLESLGTLHQPPISSAPSPSCDKGRPPMKPNRPVHVT